MGDVVKGGSALLALQLEPPVRSLTCWVGRAWTREDRTPQEGQASSQATVSISICLGRSVADGRADRGDSVAGKLNRIDAPSTPERRMVHACRPHSLLDASTTHAGAGPRTLVQGLHHAQSRKIAMVLWPSLKQHPQPHNLGMRRSRRPRKVLQQLTQNGGNTQQCSRSRRTAAICFDGPPIFRNAPLAAPPAGLRVEHRSVVPTRRLARGQATPPHSVQNWRSASVWVPSPVRTWVRIRVIVSDTPASSTKSVLRVDSLRA